MIESLRIAVSGLNAAVGKVAASASNIANGSTPNYKPVESFNSAEQAGPTPAGVLTQIRLSGAPQVSLDEEVVSLTTATNAYKANAAVIKAVDKVQDELLRAVDTST